MKGLKKFNKKNYKKEIYKYIKEIIIFIFILK